MNEPESIYAQLAWLLRDRKDQVCDIEILPPEFGALVHDGLSIGITKAALAQAFCVARRKFFDASPRAETVFSQTTQAEANEPNNDDDGTSVDTAIILLFDAEHLTACNWRKRRLVHLLKESPDEAVAAFRTEITFTTTLLRSPLHRHTKSPTLWHHRLCAVGQILTRGEPDPLNLLLTVLGEGQLQSLGERDSETTQQIVRAELAVVLKSGKQHPMNYYAFSYMREFLRLVGRALQNSSAHRCHRDTIIGLHENGRDTSGGQAFPCPLMRSLVKGRVLDDMHAWNHSRPGDTSGWSFLTFLLDVTGDSILQKSVVEETVQFALGIAWGGEPLWRFVDESSAKFGISLDTDSLMPATVKGSCGGSPSARRWERWAHRANISSGQS